MDATTELVNKLNQYVINPILALVFAAGLLVFIFGIVEFLWNGEASNKGQGKQHMLWGLIGMFIMVAAYSILKIVVNTVGYTPGVHL
jgi:hypothetical protein